MLTFDLNVARTNDTKGYTPYILVSQQMVLISSITVTSVLQLKTPIFPMWKCKTQLLSKNRYRNFKTSLKTNFLLASVIIDVSKYNHTPSVFTTTVYICLNTLSVFTHTFCAYDIRPLKYLCLDRHNLTRYIHHYNTHVGSLTLQHNYLTPDDLCKYQIPACAILRNKKCMCIHSFIRQ